VGGRREPRLIAGVDLGQTGPLTPQAQVGDFLIPRRGLIAIGCAYFESTGDRASLRRS
jgi:hypothetical protein